MFLLVIAGYETTAISLTWALIELARNPEAQQKLREELLQLSDGDASWDQITSSLPYLDAVTCEILRLHPPAVDIVRQAHEDDVIPLSKPIHDLEGQLVDNIFIAKGTTISVPIMCLNRSEVMWGREPKEFNPNRWLNDSVYKERAAEIQGYRHLLTFIDGPRTCLGKGFALTEFKAVLSVLVRNFSFALPDGPGTKIERHEGILPRPKVAGQDGAKVPMVVRHIDR
ncbi:11-oxo-beta-amyrin 30-oxidase [Hypsizygus marmoreus]|uniref:11-oxo-beta-amyrin 30-oxidase n=1 Tax=Hypsizygus marmoreus TaxID=39966 RepID=A0A369JGE7_HYPMA|nr:11-oxo-beta-amyrin 30-oxidase [Hypsizygus marmoreus]